MEVRATCTGLRPGDDLTIEIYDANTQAKEVSVNANRVEEDYTVFELGSSAPASRTNLPR